ncbi:SDR family NAD(P)-dependent oxidoreductase [Nonomuraea cavernae]|uniref:Beta-ketoacyl-ACP reductase n=1 Tax=Nonomuraea cavernae TaxID=2045107 RepID=A0A917ZGN8_9ACTN|nr:SDR family oxidoreductase [Nonomuraea cavernae]MCA2189479.1 SDR family oxidoreductase [Nonomuraea cavernae]GGO82147.1 beta-ketoacyl-ACP reductase [Nonomuraea cavernae]
MDLGLTGKSVLITGASSGIGRATACLFAAEGARVALTYRSNKDGAHSAVAEIEQAGGTAIATRYDLGDPATIRATVDSVIDAYGGVDVLVANASPWSGPHIPFRAFEDVPVAEWQSQLREELDGAFHTVQAVLPSMKARGWGRMIFVSAASVRSGIPGEEAFIASKAGLNAFSRTLAGEAGTSGILSVVVSPGATATDTTRRALPPKLMSQVAASAATGRISTPEEVARAIVFLGSEANGNITGTIVEVTGGT